MIGNANDHRTTGSSTSAIKTTQIRLSSSDSSNVEIPLPDVGHMSFDSDMFHDANLQMAVDIFNEAKALRNDGNHKEACEEYQSAIMIGRKVVQKRQENAADDDDYDDSSAASADDPRLALEWLICSYLAMFQSRVKLGDWSKARADAWAACNYAQYSPNGSLGGDGMDAKSFRLEQMVLSAMWMVCQNTGDKLNEWQTLQSLKRLLKLPFPEKVVNNDNDGITRKQVEERIKELQDELEAKS
ncbi:MAG: hypothetical protein SGBAC_010417 [Bacillariaceae sp.]